MTEKYHTHKYFLTAGETNAEGRMPLTLIVERIIELASEHANKLNLGYASLIEQNIGWVLSRLSVEMMSLPDINSTYTVCTWIESINRRLSERNFSITGENGEVYGFARTVWVPMNFDTRTVADLGAFDLDSYPIGNLACPIEKTPRIAALGEEARATDYDVKYCDIDFNRHVNTVRYIEMLMNQWPLEHFDRLYPRRFDILFRHECRFGETLSLRVADKDNVSDCEIVKSTGDKAIAARFIWQEYEHD